MGSLSDIVTVNVSLSTVSVLTNSFGIPLIVGASQRFPQVQRSYSDVAGMIADGFLATDPEVLAAQAICAQNPRPKTFMVGRRALLPTMQAKLTPSALNLQTYRAVVDGKNADYTSDGTATVAEITAGLKAAIDALAPAAWAIDHAYTAGTRVTNDSGKIYTCSQSGTSAHTGGPTGMGSAAQTDNTAKWIFSGVVPTVVDASTYLTATSPVAGGWFRLAVDDDPATVGHAGLAVEWTHADPGIATDLAAIAASDSSWYGACLTTCGTAEVLAAATWTEANGKLLVQATPQTTCATAVLSGATDIAATLAASTENRSPLIFHRDPGEFADAAWMSSRFAIAAGSESWKFAQLSGVTADRLTETMLTNLKAKHCNWVTSFSGVTITGEGTVPSGQFVDTIRGRDAFAADVQASIFAAMVNAGRTGKVPFTNKGIGTIESQLRASGQRFTAIGFFAPNSFQVSVPAASDVSSADKAARSLTGITFTATLAGAVHSVTINGNVTA